MHIPSSIDIKKYTSNGKKYFKSNIHEVEKYKGEVKIIQF